MIVISSCIVGEKYRYNATDAYRPLLIESIEDAFIALCPEVLAGLEVPREPCEIAGGCGEDVLRGTAQILGKNGIDTTEAMLCGANKALQICLDKGVVKAYLKSKSPTCGCGKIYDGNFTGTLKSGNGVFTALLKIQGIEIVEVE